MNADQNQRLLSRISNFIVAFSLAQAFTPG